MTESSKYDLFMEELTSLEKQVYVFVQKNYELSDKNLRLEKKLQQFESENEVLKLRIEELESKLNDSSFEENNLFQTDSITVEDREVLRGKISELISKIDYHLRS